MVIEMPVQIALPDLIKVIERLPSAELESVFTQISQIYQRRHNETALLTQIHRRLPDKQQTRLRTLSQKLESETITETELTELQKLIKKTESLDAERAEALVLLAQIRTTTVRQLMQELKLGLYQS